MERQTRASVYELVQQDHYTPEELSALLGIGLDTIRHAAFTRELRAQILEHDILRIRREDVIAWLDERESHDQGSIADARG
jgi:hypothetical protein